MTCSQAAAEACGAALRRLADSLLQVASAGDGLYRPPVFVYFKIQNFHRHMCFCKLCARTDVSRPSLHPLMVAASLACAANLSDSAA